VSSPRLKLLGLVWLLLVPHSALADPGSALAESNPATLASGTATVGTNFNDGGPWQPEMPEHIFRSAAAGNSPLPAISTRDLANGITPVVISGTVHSLSGPATKLTDGLGPSDQDDPANCFFYENNVALGRFRISLEQPESIGQINLYAWHRNGQFGGARAPLRVNVYASDGTAQGFNSDDPASPGYVLLARINTLRPGGVNAQGGQHGASVFFSDGKPLGRFRHFLFEALPPVDGLVHTFIGEVDIVAAAGPKLIAADSAGGQHFDEHIAPLLSRRCLDCHNPTDKKGGLDLASAAAAATGGDSGPGFLPGAADSLLLDRVGNDEMPPKHPLSAAEKQLLRDWVASGAGWGTSPIDRFRYSSDNRAGFDWWALKPISALPLPAVRQTDWPSSAIDRWVLALLEAKQLSPAPAADRRTLIRRVTFDLTGLPPTPDEIERFINDDAPQAYERLVDRLLASPHYGERWARHWLDLVRFSESQGFERNKYYPSAWKYRDWVVQAFNADLPYDEFIRLQLAGDVLHPDDPRAIVAAGYLVATPHDLLGLTQGSPAMKAGTREDELENLIGNIGQTFLGLTINCARCHDHKFDPLEQAEYFQLASAVGGLARLDRALPALAASTQSSTNGSPRAVEAQAAEDQLAVAIGLEGAKAIQEFRATGIEEAEASLAKAQAVVDEREKRMLTDANGLQVTEDWRRQLRSAQDLLAYARQPHSTLGLDRLLEQVPRASRPAYSEAIARLSALDAEDRLTLGGTAMGFSSAPPQYFHLLRRGSFRDPGEVVSPRGFRCLATLSPDWGVEADAPETQRRLRLAEWITDPHNPLPARVIVNRLWHYHFGIGLVDTPSDFGFSGGRPSHPALLDQLAADLIANRWSLKALQREIVLSATYRQSTTFNANAAKVDADNRLLWRHAPQRLDAESARDAVLAVSGELNLLVGGPSFHDFQVDMKADNMAYRLVNDFGPSTNRRTLYRTVVREASPPLLETLDCADPSVSSPRRTVTTTPLQALSLLNNGFMRQAATALGARVHEEAGSELDPQIERVYRLVLGRAATETELQLAHNFAAEFGLAEFCLVILNSNEFLYVD
jgi:Protein of unknown function (DUF1553)/Protein of unknown function (DUF1549)/Planctomycete cytochrome C